MWMAHGGGQARCRELGKHPLQHVCRCLTLPTLRLPRAQQVHVHARTHTCARTYAHAHTPPPLHRSWVALYFLLKWAFNACMPLAVATTLYLAFFVLTTLGPRSKDALGEGRDWPRPLRKWWVCTSARPVDGTPATSASVPGSSLCQGLLPTCSTPSCPPGFVSGWERRRVWRWLADHFPAQLVRTTTLQPEGRYMFVMQPHGLCALSGWLNFSTDATGFARLFPGEPANSVLHIA